MAASMAAVAAGSMKRSKLFFEKWHDYKSKNKEMIGKVSEA